MGASEIGQGYTGPKTGNQGQGIESGTHKKIMLQGQGIKPWTHKIDCVQGQGFKPWTDQKDRLYDCAHDHSYNCVYELRINKHTKDSADAQTSSMWNTSAG